MGSANSVPICAYTISGSYDMVARFIYYFLLTCSLFLNSEQWITTITLGSSMLVAAVASVHAVILAIANSGQVSTTVDLDVLPIYAITSVAVVIAIPELFYLFSLTMTKVAPSTRSVFFLWGMLVVAGNISSASAIYNIRTILDKNRSACGITAEESCTLICGDHLPLRNGQNATMIWFHATILPKVVLAWSLPAVLFFLFAIGYDYAGYKQVRKRGGKGWRWWAIVVAWFILTCSNVGWMEYILNEPKGPPKTQKFRTIGQLGPLIALGFSSIAAFIRFKFPGPETEKSNNKHEDVRYDLPDRASLRTVVTDSWDDDMDQESSKKRRASNYSG